MKLRLASTALDGRTVTLTLMQEGVTVGPLTVAAWGGAPATRAGSVTVKVSRTPTRTAPEEVFFDVTGWGGFDTAAGPVAGPDQRRHRLVHLWDFDDPGATWTAPVNVLAEWRDANRSHGPFTAHVYSRPGTYDPSCLVIEPSSGKTALWRASENGGAIVVADPDVTFAGNKTAYVDPDGDWSAAPAAVTQRVTTIGAAKNLVRGRTAGGRILLARGKAHEMSLGLDNAGPLFITAASGAGARPTVRPAVNGNTLINANYGYKGGQVTLSGFDARGPWDPVTNTVTNGSTSVPGCFLFGFKGTALIDDCSFKGFDTVLNSIPFNVADHPDSSTTLNNVAITDWVGYGCYSDASHGRWAYLGTMMADHPQHVAGFSHGQIGGAGQTQGPVRMVGKFSYKRVFDGCDFYAHKGWSMAGSFRAEQPCARILDLGPDSFLNMQRSAFEGGMGMLTLANDSTPGAIDVLMDHLIFVGSWQTTTAISINRPGFTLRNAMFIVPNVNRMGTDFRPTAFVSMGAASGAEPPARVENCTLINHLSAANGSPSVRIASHAGAAPPASLCTVADCIVHQPNLATPQVAFAPLDQTPLWTPRSIGYRHTAADPVDGSRATPPGTVWAGTPLEGSSARGGAVSDDTPYDDIRGRVRPVHPSAGAAEA